MTQPHDYGLCAFGTISVCTCRFGIVTMALFKIGE